MDHTSQSVAAVAAAVVGTVVITSKSTILTAGYTMIIASFLGHQNIPSAACTTEVIGTLESSPVVASAAISHSPSNFVPPLLALQQ